MTRSASMNLTTPSLFRVAALRAALLKARALRATAALAALIALLWPALAGAVLPIEHWTTRAGARVYFVRAASIPMVDLSISFDAGDRYDPVDRSGLASLTTAMLAKGVPGADEAEIAERFASVGAQRGGSVGDDRAVVTLRSLASEAELASALATLERTLAAPAFPAEVLAREKERVIQALREAQTKPETLAHREFGRLLYPQHPYGAYATPESVSSIRREDLQRFHRTHFAAPRAVVAMIGALSRERAEALAEQLTANLPPGGDAPRLPAVTFPERPVERRIPHPASQSHILIGAPGIAWGDPDQFALTVGNYILGGGGFVSRLYDEVREKRGLAYSVYSYFTPSLQPGPFTIGLQTQRGQTDLALQVVRETLARFLADGPTEDEVAAAKANLIGGFALRIDSNVKILGYLSTIGFYGLPLDYLDRWTERIAQVDARQIREAFARHLNGAVLATVVVGATADESAPAQASRTLSGVVEGSAGAAARGAAAR